MSGNYFVAGLPRSRTAWLSVFLSQSGKYCFHDGLNGCNNLEEYQRKIDGCGDSSTGLGLFDVKALYPDSPTIIIEKSDEEIQSCIEWCDATYDTDSREQLLSQYKKIMEIDGVKIKQPEINDNLQFIFEHLTGCRWHEHFANLTSLSIQANPYAIDVDAMVNLLNERIQ